MKNKTIKQKRPIPKKGTQFTGWATFNWGICHQRVFRTRKQAKEFCCDPGQTWDDVKDHFTIVKVFCETY
jgi:hypothetical protein